MDDGLVVDVWLMVYGLVFCGLIVVLEFAPAAPLRVRALPPPISERVWMDRGNGKRVS